MKINKTSSNYNNFINVLSNAKDLNELNSFFYKPENVNFKTFSEIFTQTINLKRDIQNDYHYFAYISQQNIQLISLELYNKYKLEQSNIPKKTAFMMGSGPDVITTCADTFFTSSDRCDRNGTIGMVVCLFTLPSGLGYVGCTGLVMVTTALCFSDATDDYNTCVRNSKK